MRVTDGLGATSDATVTVTAAVAISPTTATVAPGEGVSFSGIGGDGTYGFSLAVNNSGSSIDPVTGAYTAGSTAGVTDTVRVTDGLGATADAAVTVNPLTPDVLEVRVAASSDDAEERISGYMKRTSGDLELVFDKTHHQTVGMRFNGVTIPPGATILDASVQFQADEVNTVATTVTIQGEATDNASTFIQSSGNITSRPRTTAAWATGRRERHHLYTDLSGKRSSRGMFSKNSAAKGP